MLSKNSWIDFRQSTTRVPTVEERSNGSNFFGRPISEVFGNGIFSASILLPIIIRHFQRTDFRDRDSASDHDAAVDAMQDVAGGATEEEP